MNSQMTSVRPYLFVILTLCLGLIGTPAHTQTNISGVINSYVSVTALDLATNRMTVNSTAGFAVGDMLLIMQMQGASINTSNSSSFGNVNNYNGAGNYELAILCEIDNNDFVFENTLVNSGYSTAGNIQIIRVPSYTDATVTATLTGQAWNGSTGGVLALAVTNTLLLNADINMDGMGFRGGAFELASSPCWFLSNYNNYRYNSADIGGKKGEGIAAYVSGMEYGRGAQANGGGGGNDHNTGGGGGSNGATGGIGGRTTNAGCPGNYPGVSGKVPALNASRIFMGGGGGAGHSNSNTGDRGAHGGGIILIIANTVQVGTPGVSISANGENAPKAEYDGAGGGGAGGSIQLEVNTFTGVPTIMAQGGDGGISDNQTNNQCFGPGGGGSGGVIKSNPALPGTIAPDLSGGNPGYLLLSGCTGNQNAGTGTTGTMLTSAIPVGTIPDPSCGLLPVTWLEFDARPVNQHMLVSWKIGSEQNNDFFTVERSADGINFSSVSEIKSRGNSLLPADYQWTDKKPMPGTSFYRVSQTNLDGFNSYTEIVKVQSERRIGFHVYPNPVGPLASIQVELVSPGKEEVFIEAFDFTGKQVYRQRVEMQAGNNVFELDRSAFGPGAYLVRVYNETVSEQGKVVVR